MLCSWEENGTMWGGILLRAIIAAILGIGGWRLAIFIAGRNDSASELTWILALVGLNSPVFFSEQASSHNLQPVHLSGFTAIIFIQSSFLLKLISSKECSSSLGCSNIHYLISNSNGC